MNEQVEKWKAAMTAAILDVGDNMEGTLLKVEMIVPKRVEENLLKLQEIDLEFFSGVLGLFLLAGAKAISLEQVIKEKIKKLLEKGGQDE